MPFLTTDDDCEIYYEAHGHGPALVFISGFMGITTIWQAQIEAFRDRHRCIAFDTRGAGRSEKPLPRVAYGVKRHARDLAAVLDALDVDRAVLVGHSMGGNIALETYALDPARIAGLAFVGSYVAGAQIVAAGNAPDALRAAVSRPTGRVAFYTSVGLSESIAMEAAKWPLYALLGNAESFLAFDGSALLPTVKVPCLIVHGDSDVVTPFEPCATALAAGLHDAQVVKLPDVNHCPMTEAPDPTNRALAAFLPRCA